MPSKLALTSPGLMEFRADAGELAICPPAQMPGSLAERPSRFCLGCSRWAQAAANADYGFVWVGGIEGKCLPGLNHLASGPRFICTPIQRSNGRPWCVLTEHMLIPTSNDGACVLAGQFSTTMTGCGTMTFMTSIDYAYKSCGQ